VLLSMDGLGARLPGSPRPGGRRARSSKRRSMARSSKPSATCRSDECSLRIRKVGCSNPRTGAILKEWRPNGMSPSLRVSSSFVGGRNRRWLRFGKEYRTAYRRLGSSWKGSGLALVSSSWKIRTRAIGFVLARDSEVLGFVWECRKVDDYPPADRAIGFVLAGEV
jgi:hypothetical protein